MRIRWRGLELPSLIGAERSTLTATYGKFIAEPFERGFGVTVGNSLRRILLSSLEGSAVTQIKVHGAQHEFSSLPGVIEDVTDVVLNVKSLVVKNHSEQTRVVRIEKDKKGPITGADVRTDDQVNVINKDLGDRHADRGRAVSAGNGDREWPRIRAGDRAHAAGARDRDHPG